MNLNYICEVITILTACLGILAFLVKSIKRTLVYFQENRKLKQLLQERELEINELKKSLLSSEQQANQKHHLILELTQKIKLREEKKQKLTELLKDTEQKLDSTMLELQAFKKEKEYPLLNAIHKTLLEKMARWPSGKRYLHSLSLDLAWSTFRTRTIATELKNYDLLKFHDDNDDDRDLYFTLTDRAYLYIKDNKMLSDCYDITDYDNRRRN